MLKLRQSAYSHLFTFVFLVISGAVLAQSQGITMQNLPAVKVDDLTDEQLSQFWAQAQSSGISMDKLESIAKQKKMPPEEFEKLKNRIAKLGTSTTERTEALSGNKKQNDEPKDPVATTKVVKSKIFGADLFTTRNLTFEPNLKMATPQNYLLGPDDELLIDVYGNSEVTHRLKVSPEGSIRIPLVGPVMVSGLTIEQARKRIVSQLGNIYSGIHTGETSVNVTLANIRSIKVTLLGEINMPGSYTLPSLATVFNALYVSGGPGANGSFRNIKVIRNNKTVATLDVYEFLIKGDAKGNIRLQDQDVIKIGFFETRVELIGEVKHPGIFEVVKGETLNDVIGFAGGFTDNAYRETIKVFRNTPKEKSVADVPAGLQGLFIPQPGDVYTIDKLLERFSNRVQINGAIFRPGYFSLEKGLTLSSLIKKAEGLREDAFLDRGLLYRLKEDNSSEVISFNVNEVMQGKNDIVLKREDNIQIASKLEIREGYAVSISGEVLKPGTFNYAENMKVEDLVLAAGGLKESASSKVQISRRIMQSDSGSSGVVMVIPYELNKNLNTSGSLLLMPFDHVSVFPPAGYTAIKRISVIGEVMYPGEYSIIKKDERVSDVIKRAGGITKYAFEEGAVLLRKPKFDEIDNLINKKKNEALLKQSSDEEKGRKLAETDYGSPTGVVGIDLLKILKNPGSKYDLQLQENDVIRISKREQTVKVNGEVLYPSEMRYDRSNNFKDYISGAGGYSAKALKKRSYIVYSNGSASSTRHFLFLKFYPRVKPGGEIFVPVKLQTRKLAATEIVGITSGLATMVFLLYTVLK